MSWNIFNPNKNDKKETEDIPIPREWIPYQENEKLTEAEANMNVLKSSRPIACLESAGAAFLIGFGAGGGLAFLGGAGFGLFSPYFHKQRWMFLSREVPKLVLKSGGAFGSILAVGGWLRCL